MLTAMLRVRLFTNDFKLVIDRVEVPKFLTGYPRAVTYGDRIFLHCDGNTYIECHAVAVIPWPEKSEKLPFNG